MPKRSQNDVRTDEFIREVAKLVGVDEEFIRKVYKAQELLLYHQARQSHQENPDDEMIDLELPFIGNLKIYKVNYRNRTDVKNDAALRTKMYPCEVFRKRLRSSVYDNKDFLLDSALATHKGLVVNKFRSMIE
ncbi:hypothetical protein CEW46_24690 [Bacillus cereus]|nr:hypothetical protein CEW46_24690 [Bacillus cereus]